MLQAQKYIVRFVRFLKNAGGGLALHPFLFALYVVCSPLIVNLDDVNPEQAVRPLIALLLIAAIGLLGLRRVFKEWHYPAYLVFLFLAYFFIFGHLNRVIHNWLPAYPLWASLLTLAAWTGLWVFLGLRRTWQRLGGAARLTPALNLFSTVSLSILGLNNLRC